MNGFPADLSGRAIKLHLPWDYLLGEVALADEVRDDVNFVRIDHVKRLSHRGFFFPETTMNLAKQPPPADFVGVVEIGRRRIGILGGTVTDNEKGALRLWRDGHGGKLARLERNARPWHSVLSFALPILVLDAENPAIACDDPRELVLESGQERAKTAGMFERLQLWLDPKPRNGPEAMAVDEWLLETTTIPILRYIGGWGTGEVLAILASSKKRKSSCLKCNGCAGGQAEVWSIIVLIGLTRSLSRFRSRLPA
jgi:hypothetical protein